MTGCGDSLGDTGSASEMTNIVSSWALNSTHSLTTDYEVVSTTSHLTNIRVDLVISSD